MGDPGVASNAAAAAPTASDALEKAHARLLADKTLQFDFSAVKPPPPPPHWLDGLARFLDSIAPAMKIGFWLVLAAIVVAILAYIAREFVRMRWPDRWAKKPPMQIQDDWRPTQAQARALLEDADRLAAEGRFEEAIHLILFRSIQDIQGRRPDLLTPSLTSRDIAGLEGLPAAARAPFAGIAALVERSFFAGRAVGAEGFAECRQAYERFAFPEAWA